MDCYALNSYLLEPNRFRVQPILLSQPFCNFIGDEHAVYHWTAAEYTHYELAFYSSFSEIAEGVIW